MKRALSLFMIILTVGLAISCRPIPQNPVTPDDKPAPDPATFGVEIEYMDNAILKKVARVIDVDVPDLSFSWTLTGPGVKQSGSGPDFYMDLADLDWGKSYKLTVTASDGEYIRGTREASVTREPRIYLSYAQDPFNNGDFSVGAILDTDQKVTNDHSFGWKVTSLNGDPIDFQIKDQKYSEFFKNNTISFNSGEPEITVECTSSEGGAPTSTISLKNQDHGIHGNAMFMGNQGIKEEEVAGADRKLRPWFAYYEKGDDGILLSDAELKAGYVFKWYTSSKEDQNGKKLLVSNVSDNRMLIGLVPNRNVVEGNSTTVTITCEVYDGDNLLRTLTKNVYYTPYIDVDKIDKKDLNNKLTGLEFRFPFLLPGYEYKVVAKADNNKDWTEIGVTSWKIGTGSEIIWWTDDIKTELQKCGDSEVYYVKVQAAEGYDEGSNEPYNSTLLESMTWMLRIVKDSNGNEELQISDPIRN